MQVVSLTKNIKTALKFFKQFMKFIKISKLKILSRICRCISYSLCRLPRTLKLVLRRVYIVPMGIPRELSSTTLVSSERKRPWEWLGRLVGTEVNEN